MDEVISKPRAELNPYAPRIEAVQMPKDKIGEVIGPKGKMIRQIEEETGATLEIEDDGTVRIGAADGESLRKAKDWVLAIAFPPEAEVGKEYEGEVVNITKFGAFVNILPGRDGLLHISKMGGGKRIDRSRTCSRWATRFRWWCATSTATWQGQPRPGGGGGIGAVGRRRRGPARGAGTAGTPWRAVRG